MGIYSFSPFGYEGALVTVEVDLRRGIPAIDMVGLADGAVRESRERMRAAIINSGFTFPPERILISLSPADVRKEGAGFDLAIAIAVLAAAAKVNPDAKIPISNFDSAGAVLVMGELELSGKVRPVRGIHAAVSSALEQNIRRCIVPAANAAEAAAAGMAVFAADSLKNAFQALSMPSLFSAVDAQSAAVGGVLFSAVTPAVEYADVRGQTQLVRGLQIAAAGGHNVLVYGPPGCGKTLAISRFAGLLPLLTDEEAQPVTRIHSLAGNLPANQPLIRIPPIRTPHQSTSLEGIIGGGKQCAPGEISLAHNGVLFFDEAAEFKTTVLQSLRVPLETGLVTVTRAGRNSAYPARFQFLAAMNPCPCGNFATEGKICLCSARTVDQYWKKISAPLIDRIDIRIPVFPGTAKDCAGIPTANLRQAISRAVTVQREQRKTKNNFLLPEEIRRSCALDSTASGELTDAARLYGFSARGIDGCLKVARTIADMAGSTNIRTEHIQEAISFRKNEGGVSFGF